MTEETVGVDEIDAAAPAAMPDANPEPEWETDEAEDTAGDDAPGDGGEDDAEPEDIEIDLGGTKYRFAKAGLPDDLAAKVQDFGKSLYSDYIAKTQGIAEQRQAIQAQKEDLDKLSLLNGEVMGKYAHGQAMAARLQQLRGQYSDDMWRSNPDNARRLSDAIAAAERDFQAAVQDVGQAERALIDQREQSRTAAAERGRAYVERKIQDFAKIENDLVDYVRREYGISERDAKNWALSPEVTTMAVKAMRYDQLQAKAKAAGKPAAKAATPVTPVKGTGGGSAPKPGTPAADAMSIDAWMRLRNAASR
jgi:hypothetical protein